jgi:fumarate hydratase class II
MEKSLMLVTALAPRLGYDEAARIAKSALMNNTTLREEALKSGQISMQEFNDIVDPKKMITPSD